MILCHKFDIAAAVNYISDKKKITFVGSRWPLVQTRYYTYRSFSWKLDQTRCCFHNEIKIQLKHETF